MATLASGVTLTSEVVTVVSVTWDASLLGTADGSAVELRIVGTASVDRSVEVGAVEWDARVPGTGAELYFLRARYYEPATGRFIGRDPLEFAQRYAYAGNNPVAFTDPSGLEGEPSFGQDCYVPRTILPAEWATVGARCSASAGSSTTGAHQALEACGLSPAIGIACDVPNAIWYLGEGDFENAAWSGAAALPLVGLGVTGGKWTRRFARLLRFGDEAADAGIVASRLRALPGGRSSGVSIVNSASDLRSLYDDLASGGSRISVEGYNGFWTQLPDGTRLGLRNTSRSGGPTIDVKYPDGGVWRVHVD